MTAALTLADQGFPVHLVEKDEELGGTARQLHHTLDGRDIQAYLADTIRRVTNNPRITVYLRSKSRKGRRAHWQFPLDCDKRFWRERNFSMAPLFVATGATEAKPQSFGYGKNPQVITQLELTDRLGRGEIKLPATATVAMNPMRGAA